MCRWHKAAFDGAKQVAKLQAEAKAATAQSDSATAAAMEAKGLAKRLEMLAVQKQHDAAVHAVLGQQAQVQASEPQHAQQAQRAASPALQGPAKSSVLLKPSLLVHSPSRLSRMTSRAYDSVNEDSSQIKGPQVKPNDIQQGPVRDRTSTSRAMTPQGSGLSDRNSAEPTHDTDQNSYQSNSNGNCALQQQNSIHAAQQGAFSLQPLSYQSTDNEQHQQGQSGPNNDVRPDTSDHLGRERGNGKRRSSSLQRDEPDSSTAVPASLLQQQRSLSTSAQQSRRSTLDSSQRGFPATGAAVHTQGEGFEQDLDKQEWEQTDIDDIAAAVAQYTGSKQKDLPVQDTEPQQAQHDRAETPQRRSKPQLALQQRDSFKKSSSFHHREGEDSDRADAQLSYAEQQARMDAELQAAMFADQGLEEEDGGGGSSTARQYASPQEQMEAELEAAMAADMAADAAGDGSRDTGGDRKQDQWESTESALDTAGARGGFNTGLYLR